MRAWTLETLEETNWFGALLDQVREEIERRRARPAERRPALERALKECRGRIRGRSQSLGNPDLDPSVRAVVEADLKEDLRHQTELERELAEQDVLQGQARSLLDPQQVVDRLNRLPAVLAGNDPTRGNLELSLHIDRIRCFQGGEVIVRTCKLGALAGATEVLRSEAPDEPTAEASVGVVAKATPRRRARLRVEGRDDQGNDLAATALAAADVHRFAGLGPEWFWEDKLKIVPVQSWAQRNAAEVGRMRKEGKTHVQLAAQFDVSVPTIREALGAAARDDPTLAGLPRKMPRARWPEQHFEEVARLHTQGLSQAELCRHFDRSPYLIGRALRLAAEQAPKVAPSDPGLDAPAPDQEASR